MRHLENFDLDSLRTVVSCPEAPFQTPTVSENVKHVFSIRVNVQTVKFGTSKHKFLRRSIKREFTCTAKTTVEGCNYTPHSYIRLVLLCSIHTRTYTRYAHCTTAKYEISAHCAHNYVHVRRLFVQSYISNSVHDIILV